MVCSGGLFSTTLIETIVLEKEEMSIVLFDIVLSKRGLILLNTFVFPGTDASDYIVCTLYSYASENELFIDVSCTSRYCNDFLSRIFSFSNMILNVNITIIQTYFYTLILKSLRIIRRM